MFTSLSLMIPYSSDVIFNTRRLELKEATTLQDTTTLTQRKSSEYSLPSEISSLLILVCFLSCFLLFYGILKATT